MVNKDGSIQSEAVIKGQHYKVIETKKGGNSSVWAARDRIRNLTTGQDKEMTRKEWKDLFDRFR